MFETEGKLLWLVLLCSSLKSLSPDGAYQRRPAVTLPPRMHVVLESTVVPIIYPRFSPTLFLAMQIQHLAPTPRLKMNDLILNSLAFTLSATEIMRERHRVCSRT